MSLVYHLTTLAELEAGSHDGRYAPAAYASEGFIHCASSLEIALEVAAAYFSKYESIWVLVVDTGQLDVEVRFEPPAPPKSLGAAPAKHHQPGRLFPHIYGTLPMRAVTERIRLVQRDGVWTKDA